MTDSAPVTIPTTYGPACETFRFAWRNERFVLTVFRLRPGPKRNGPAGRPPSSDLGEVEACLPKKLRESAPKIMKSLSRVTLCAWAASTRVSPAGYWQSARALAVHCPKPLAIMLRMTEQT
jgi:hypothetical protein